MADEPVRLNDLPLPTVIRTPPDILAAAQIPPDELMECPALYMRVPALARMLALHELYRNHVLTVTGDVYCFGVKWGQDMVWFNHLRALYEPWAERRIVGFDTFSGFPSVHTLDGNHAVGELATTPGYEQLLTELIMSHDKNVMGVGHNFRLVKGDVCETLPMYFAKNPATIISLAWFDLDLYEPTKTCLQAIAPFLTRGSVLAFDDTLSGTWPGATIAIGEALGFGRYRLRRWPQSRSVSYCVVE